MDKKQPSLKSISSIELFKPAPAWSLVSKLPSDWVLRQRRRRKVKKTKASKIIRSPKNLTSPLKGKKASDFPKSRIACGLSPIKDFEKSGLFSSSMIKKVKKNSRTTIMSAYIHITNILVAGRRKRILG